jgi:ABC-type transport system involved in multi-copper enzyme maturation permease subunit
MTVLTLPAQPGQDTDAALRPIPWRRMAWVTWRQHRATLISVPAVLGAVAVFLLIAGLKVHHDYTAFAACPLNGSNESDACQRMISHFNSTDWTMGNTVLILLNLAPALLGAFAGAPVLARELETGTYRYAWTQGFGRERWTIAKLVLLGVAIAALAGAFSQLFVWFFRPFLSVEGMNVLAATVFTTHGVAFAAWTLAAFAIGAFAGMLIRRIVPAMAVTLGAYLGLDLVTWLLLRKNYPVSLVTGNPAIGTGPSSPDSPWILSTWFTGPGGKPASQSVLNQIFSQFPTNGAPRTKLSLPQLLAEHQFTEWTRYIPVSRFWPMQFIEGGWLLALSVLLIAATVWLVHRRAA